MIILKDEDYFHFNKYMYKLKRFNMFLGGRGIGKTYDACNDLIEKHELLKEGRMFIYMRLTDAQIKTCKSAMGNPFKKWNSKKNRHIELCENVGSATMIRDMDDKKKCLGYACALSTIGNLRGIDGSDVDIIWLDEALQREPLKYDAYKNFCDFYETINRSRELEGLEPVKVICTSNSQTLHSPLLAGFGLINELERVVRKSGGKMDAGEVQENIDGEFTKGSWYVCLLSDDNAVTRAKKETDFYKNIEGTDVYEESIGNKFANESFNLVGYRPLKGMKPFAMLDRVVFYKTTNGCIYMSNRQQKLPDEMKYTTKDTLPPFLYQFRTILLEAYLRNRLYYEDMAIKVFFDRHIIGRRYT